MNATECRVGVPRGSGNGLAPSGHGRARGFTLIELLVVVVILAILTALLAPAVQSARETARRAGCMHNLRQIGLAVHSYATAQGCLPPGQIYWANQRQFNAALPCWSQVTDRSFLVAILPQIEQRPLFDSINQDLSIHMSANRTALSATVSAYGCPSDPDSHGPREGLDDNITYYDGVPAGRLFHMTSGSYAGVRGLDPSAAPPHPELGCRPDPRELARADGCITDATVSPLTLASIRDGLSSTLMASERAVASWRELAPRGETVRQPVDYMIRGWWWSGRLGDTLIATHYPINAYRRTSPRQVLQWTEGASSFHPGGVNGLMADGSVRFILDSIQSWTLDEIGWPIQPPGQRTAMPGIWQALGTRNGGELIDFEDLP